MPSGKNKFNKLDYPPKRDKVKEFDLKIDLEERSDNCKDKVSVNETLRVIDKYVEKKKEEVTLLMMKEMDAFHFSWYSDDGSLGFNSLINAWADTVRGNLNKGFLCAAIRLYRYPTHFFFTLLHLPRSHFVPLPLCCIFSRNNSIHSEIERFEEKVDFPDHSLFLFASPCDSVTFSLQI